MNSFRSVREISKKNAIYLNDNRLKGRLPLCDRNTILLVDDEPGIRKSVGLFLKDEGFKVIECEDGLEGLDIFKRLKREVGIIITDIDMPNMNGIEMVLGIKKRAPKLPVIFMSGDHNPSRIESSGLTEYDFVGKPFDFNLLEEKLKKI